MEKFKILKFTRRFKELKVWIFILLVFSINFNSPIVTHGSEKQSIEENKFKKEIIENPEVYWNNLPETLINYNDITLTKERLFPYIEHILAKVKQNEVQLNSEMFHSIIKYNSTKLLSLLILNEKFSNNFFKAEENCNVDYFTETIPTIAKKSTKWRSGDMINIHTSNFINILFHKIYEQIKIQESQIKEYYNNNMSKWHKNESLEFYHVLIEPNKNRTMKDAKKLAESIFKKIAGGESISKYAEKYNVRYSRNVGGYAGSFTKGELIPELDKACWNMIPDGLNDPILIESSLGWHIINVSRYFPEKYTSLKIVTPYIENLLKRQKAEKELKIIYDSSVKLSQKLINERDIT